MHVCGLEIGGKKKVLRVRREDPYLNTQYRPNRPLEVMRFLMTLRQKLVHLYFECLTCLCMCSQVWPIILFSFTFF
jgi:hypothetical protein